MAIYLWEHIIIACVGLIFFNMRDIFGLGVCHLFPQSVLTIIHLIEDVQVCNPCLFPGR